MIVPGSLLGADHPFSWYAIVKERTTGKQWTYWFNGNQLDRAAVAAHIEAHFRGVEVVTIDPCAAMPTGILQKVPPHHFEFGIRKDLEKFVRGDDESRPASIPLRPILRKPLTRSF
jgi:hypothetical protein